jgi:hypothetical protein
MTDAYFKSFAVYALGLVAILSVAVIAGGCSQSQATDKPIKLTLKPNSICSLPERTWSVDDTPETIEEAIRFNTGRARACGEKKVTS